MLSRQYVDLLFHPSVLEPGVLAIGGTVTFIVLRTRTKKAKRVKKTSPGAPAYEVAWADGLQDNAATTTPRGLIETPIDMSALSSHSQTSHDQGSTHDSSSRVEPIRPGDLPPSPGHPRPHSHEDGLQIENISENSVPPGNAPSNT